MTELWVIRHGQTDWNVEGRYQGHQDVPLNEIGRAQARALAEQLQGKAFVALYSSDLARAAQTAEIIAAQLGMTVQLDHRLREISQGEWEGRLHSEMSQQFPQQAESRYRDPLNGRVPGGESISELAGRVAAAMDEIAQRHPPGPVLVVTHGMALATAVCHAKRISLLQIYDHIPENTGYHILHWEHE